MGSVGVESRYMDYKRWDLLVSSLDIWTINGGICWCRVSIYGLYTVRSVAVESRYMDYKR